MRERRLGQCEAGQPGLDRAGAEPQNCRRGGVRPCQHGVGDPEGAQHLQGAWMQDQGAGGPEGLAPPLDDPDPCPVVMGLQRQGETGRTGPDDQDVHCHRRVPAVTRHQSRPSSRAASSTRPGSVRTSSRRTRGSTV